jgi:exopolysaccharide biosynthesis polyprenyl glycosylphosphotransferase
MFPTNPKSHRVYLFLNVAVVLSVLVCVFAGVNWNRMPDGIGAFLAIRITVKNLLVAALFCLTCAIAFRAFGLSRPVPNAPLWKELVRVTQACAITTFFGLIFPITSHTGAFNRMVLVYFLPAAIVACLSGRLIARALADRLSNAFSAPRDLVIVGSGPRAAGLYEHVRTANHAEARVLGFIDSPNGHVVPPSISSQMLGTLDDLERILMKQPIDEVLIALPAKSCYDQIQSAIQTCERVGVHAKYLSDVFELSLARPEFLPDEQAPLMSLKVVRDDYRLAIKRGIDIVGALTGLLVFGPLMLVVAAAIKLSMPGPVFFTQERYGLHKRRFRMFKFRTMVTNAEALQASLESQNEAGGPVFKIRHDPRITPIGRILRRTSLDELPQFLNVLRGEMSLVGPRPLPARDVSRFADASLMRRFSVKPGLTCLWQISGRSNMAFNEWIRLDLRYIDDWSLSLDLAILVKTIPAVLRAEGAA